MIAADLLDAARDGRAGLLANRRTVAGHCGMRSIDYSGSKIFAADQVAARSRHGALRRRPGVMLPNPMCARSCFQRIGGFHPAFRRAQYLDLVLKAAGDGESDFVDEVLVSCHTPAGNVTNELHEFVRSSDRIVVLHRRAPTDRGDREAIRDHTVGLRADGRFAARRGETSCSANTIQAGGRRVRLGHRDGTGRDGTVRWVWRRSPRWRA